MKNAFLVLMIALASSFAMGQGQVSGKSLTTGPQLWQFFAGATGYPLSFPARTDGAVFGTGVAGELLPAACGGNPACLANAYNPSATTGHQGAAMSYTGGPCSIPPAAGTVISGTNLNTGCPGGGLNSYLVGANTQITDPDFGTSILRATDAVIQNSVTCLATGQFGIAFAGVGAGSNIVWAADDSKIIVKSSGGSWNMLAFYPDMSGSSTVGTVMPSSICGGYFPGGASFSGSDPHVIYNVVSDQENTVTITGSTGTGITTEPLTQTTTNAKSTLLAVNSSFIEIGPVTGTANNSSDWVGQTSGSHFTPNVAPPSGTANTPYANAIYEGIICDGVTGAPEESICLTNPNGGSCAANDTNPKCWYVYYTMPAEFNYLPAMVGDPHFPSCPTCGLPQNFNANYNGSFQPAMDGSSFTVVFGDNGQSNHTGYNGGGSATGYVCPNSPGGICQGPIYQANYTVGKGVRVFNSMTDQISGDWGPTGQVLDQQANDISGTVTGTLTPGDAFVQYHSGSPIASTQLICMQDSSHTCQPSGWTQMYTGVVYGSPTSSSADHWEDCGNNYPTTTCSGSNYLSPSALPTNAPFFYPDVLHDMSQSPNPQLASFSMVQTKNILVTSFSYSASLHQTIVQFSDNTVYSPGQQFNFSGLAAADGKDAYANCTDPNHCPVFTAVAIPNTGNLVCPGNGPYCPSGSNGTITITDMLGGGSSFTDTESQTGCGGHSQPACPTMFPHPQDESLANGGFGGTNFAQVQTLLVAADLMATGHHAAGCCHFFQGKFYTAISEAVPWTLATIPDLAGPPACQVSGSPCGNPYAGPLTPPPGNTRVALIPFSIVDDQHGDQGCAGTTDACPPILSTALVCGQAGSGGVGGFPCEPQYASLWDNEIIAAENSAIRSTPGNLAGADCSYDSTGKPEPCIYRLMHNFSSMSSFNFTVQNAQGAGSPDGLFYVFPSDWNSTLGCMDGTTTNCWSSWQATAPNASGTAVHWSTDGASNVTVTMTNSFCPTGGNQYYWVSSAVQTISCGTRAGTVQLTGFTESWLNNKTLTLAGNSANAWQCDSTDSNAGVCNKFILSSVTGAPPNSSGTETGTQKAEPTSCGSGVPCQRPDMWIAKLMTSHQ